MDNSYYPESMIESSNGREMYRMAKTLWPINRSITGEGVRETLAHIKYKIPDFMS